MEVHAGIDLHSSNNYTGVINGQEESVYGSRCQAISLELSWPLILIIESLIGVVAESTYSGYWLVDGQQEEGYKVHFTSPAAIKQYEGLKHTDDMWDSLWLAHMLRLNILPEGCIYPREERPIRDLLRRRLLFVKQRKSHILSLESMSSRNLGMQMSGCEIKKLQEKDVESLFDSYHLVLAAQSKIAAIWFLKNKIKIIEKEVKSQVRLREELKCLQTIPGIGDIRGFAIMLEAGDIGRFDQVGSYSSYCRCIKSERRSNTKKKGERNRKNGTNT